MVGNGTNRYTHEATITLTGNRDSPSLALGRTMVVGAKALGIFGEVSLHSNYVCLFSGYMFRLSFFSQQVDKARQSIDELVFPIISVCKQSKTEY